MDELVAINIENVHVQVKLHAIKIRNDDTLADLLKVDTVLSTEKLIEKIKREYFKLFTEEFKVSDNSMAIEIWGHVYAEKFADAVENFSSVKFIDAIANKILKHAEIIDIGERGHDDNRFVWDGLAGFKSVIAGLLFS